MVLRGIISAVLFVFLRSLWGQSKAETWPGIISLLGSLLFLESFTGFSWVILKESPYSDPHCRIYFWGASPNSSSASTWMAENMSRHVVNYSGVFEWEWNCGKKHWRWWWILFTAFLPRNCVTWDCHDSGLQFFIYKMKILNARWPPGDFS